MLNRPNWKGQRGAAAVELALILPILVLLVFGIVEFGRAYHTQVTLTHAAREGARHMAIHNDPSCKETPTGAGWVTMQAASSIGLECGEVTITPTSCTPGTDVTVLAERTFTLSIPLFPGSGTFDLEGRGVMRCGG